MQNNKYYCRIDGTIYNLKKIQDVIDENPNNPNYAKIFLLSIEEYGLPDNNSLDVVIKFNNNQIPADYNECLERMRQYNQSQHTIIKCPTCGSTSVKRIPSGVKWASALFGNWYDKTSRSQFHCTKCGYMW